MPLSDQNAVWEIDRSPSTEALRLMINGESTMQACESVSVITLVLDI